MSLLFYFLISKLCSFISVKINLCFDGGGIGYRLGKIIPELSFKKKL